MKILVTGGAGFLGSHLCERLLADGAEVWCLDNFETGFRANVAHLEANPGFHLIESDVRAPIPDLPFDQIYNLACPASPPLYQRDAVGTMRTNILGAIHVLEHARRYGSRVLQASTSEVYGDPSIHPQPEDYVGAVSCTGRRACYDEGKRAAETLFYDYHRQYSVEIRVARLFNTYGPRMDAGDGRVIPNFVMQALTNQPITVYGAGSQTRSFCYISDMIEAFLLLMNAPGARVGPINLGNPGEFTMLELAALVIDQTDSGSKILYLPLPEDDPKIRKPDITRAKAELGWTPKTPLGAGLSLTIDYFRETITSKRTPDGRKLDVAILGAGPSGLTAAYQLLKRSDMYRPVVLEARDKVGGIARTENYRGYRFDIGGHRFLTDNEEVRALWHEVLPAEDLLSKQRLSRIFYRGKYFDYPLQPLNALRNLGLYESVRIFLSYLRWRIKPHAEERNFEQWATNHFGSRLFWHFFKGYTEKFWGLPSDQIQVDWGIKSIDNLSLRRMAAKLLQDAGARRREVEQFEYPRLGPGMMWEAFRDAIRDKGGEVRTQSRVTQVYHDGEKVSSIVVHSRTHDTTTGPARESGYTFKVDHLISSIPISELVLAMSPPPPASILAAAKRIKHRDFLVVALVLKTKKIFPDHWIYIHNPEVKVGRIQNFGSWSDEMVPNPDQVSIGMGYFCQEDDELWKMDDRDLARLAARELQTLGLSDAVDVIDSHVIRQPKAYPVLDSGYREALSMIRGWLSGFSNLQVMGRNGMHRYSNQDQAMISAMNAVDGILTGRQDYWTIDADSESTGGDITA